MTTHELYIWLEGDFERPPKIETKVAPAMPLAEFRDRYVDPDRSYLIMRVYAAADDAGQNFTVTLHPAPGAPAPASETMAGTTLTGIKGIGRATIALLREKAGIESVEDLRAAGRTPMGRAALARQVGRSEQVILRWVQIADLMRLAGVGPDYSALLWEAGLKAPPDLLPQDPQGLLQILARINEEKHLTPRLPTLEQLNQWLDQAKTLPVLVLGT